MSDVQGPVWPMLFVLVACGAVSGFHSLVAGGTTSKQLTNETQGKAIAYGGMLTEGVVAVVCRGPAHEDARSTPDAVDDVVALDERLHLEEVAELLPERDAAIGIVHRQLDVCDPIDLDTHFRGSFVLRRGSR